ncbi:MAG: hypothetical protein ACFE95_11045 [Candidatus Hodarchaeota archaeon]
MSSHDDSGKRIQNSKQLLHRLTQFVKDIPDLIIEFKGAIIVIAVWLIIGDIAGYSIVTLIISIVKLIFYPLLLLFFNTGFSAINVPEIFILMVPLVILMVVGFLTIIATED